MAIITKAIKLETTQQNLIQAVIAKQNDCNSRYLKVTFLDEGAVIPLDSASEVTINAERQDGAAKSFFGVVNDDDTATVPLHSWILELDGIVNCDISIIGADSRLTTTGFVVKVEKAACGSGDISVDPQYDVLANLIDDVSGAKQITSQGRSAKYNFTTPGWKRILNIIRATNGAIDLGLASGNPYRMVQALAFDISGFVKYPTDTTDSTPTIIKRYENTFGQDDAVSKHAFKVSKIRVGYPKAGTDFPNTDGTTDYTVNPVNCYVDIYVDFAVKDHDYIAFNMNYAGFADSHKCTPITEETAASDTGIYGEELTYFTVDVDSMPYFVQSPEMLNVLTKDNVYSGAATGYGVKLHNSGYLQINSASNDLIDKGSSAYVCITPKNVEYAVKKHAPTPKVYTFTFADDPAGALEGEDIPIGSFYYRSANDDWYDPSNIHSVAVYTGVDENGEKIWTTLYQKM